ncbi:hypothetical protein [Propionivibrio sp.]|uniref:hypothetical protein n=1 Tax=Propionivibrio sp. TaxID=2212460 RepID=UPI0025DB52A2|nr:hypothetical protein [Propionivibrio sp.]MBK7355659.1 hypothetical protein [Propionivibrio sp.]MBK8400677.1 hypothetical protein [Propionivibrio sp.]MBK8745481.1 hypothetical protein [Propionivibrio sp.]MBK8893654.1 hypothetical protein [Propionivibrio sp.]MBL0207036.1 hypothetical protein [Propionivibrio sp.]
MKKAAYRVVASCALIGTLLLTGCVQMPTEKMGVSDMRPQISFTATNETLLASRVVIDGLDVGALADYTADTAALRVLSGNHRIQIYSGGTILLDEKVYLGDGVSRTFLVK